MENKRPGIVYPANITPYATGIAAWTDGELARIIRSGVDNHGRRQLPVMPWPGYQKMTSGDAMALVAFLRSLPAVDHEVPENVTPGNRADAPYVHFGVYLSRKSLAK